MVWRPEHEVPVDRLPSPGNSNREAAGTSAWVLELLLLHFDQRTLLEIELFRNQPPLLVGNPRNEINHLHPAGSREGTAFGWKALPVSTQRARLSIPASFFPREPPSSIRVSARPLPGVDQRPCVVMIVGAAWVPTRRPGATHGWFERLKSGWSLHCVWLIQGNPSFPVIQVSPG